MLVSLMSLRALADILTKVIKIGITNGKLRMAISVPLLFAFEAIEDINVNTIEKPQLPSNKANENCQ